jgi:hypothetical protein
VRAVLVVPSARKIYRADRHNELAFFVVGRLLHGRLGHGMLIGML